MPPKTRKNADFEKERKIIIWLFAPGFAIIALAIKAAQQGWLQCLAGSTTAASLGYFYDKLEFTVRYWILMAAWFAFLILYTEIQRIFSGPAGLDTLIEPGANDVNLIIGRKVLENSVEQAIVSVLGQVAILPYLSGQEVLKFIPIVNVLWFVGRILYFAGYPKRRTLGWPMSFYVSFPLVGYGLYLFTKYHLFA